MIFSLLSLQETSFFWAKADELMDAKTNDKSADVVKNRIFIIEFGMVMQLGMRLSFESQSTQRFGLEELCRVPAFSNGTVLA